MIKEFVFATKNPHKMVEIRAILGDMGVPIYSMEDIGVSVDVVEDGATFEENAIKKAVEIGRIIGRTVLADDSGLEVDYMNKEPGIYSARFGGVETSYKVKNQMIIDRLKDAKEEERTARFVCVIAMAEPNGCVTTVRGIIEGKIAHEAYGGNGFGYDPIFYVPSEGCTTAQMPSIVKNKLSHRGQALRKIRKIILES